MAKRLTPFLLFLSGFLLYAHSTGYEFSLDDKLYITHNRYVADGLSGLGEIWTSDLMEAYTEADVANQLTGGRYRPLSLSLHALEVELHQANPKWCHLLNALLYGLMIVLVFRFFQRLLQARVSDKINYWTSLFGALLYCAHPLHVEVVANVSNRAEMLSILFGLWSSHAALGFALNNRRIDLWLSGLFLLLGLLFKESALSFLPITILALLLIRTPIKPTLKVLWPVSVSYILALGLFGLLRLNATSGAASPSEEKANLLNSVYSAAEPAEKVAGILYCYGLGFWKQLVPTQLTHDYYPYHPFAELDELEPGVTAYPQMGDWEVLVSALLCLSLILLAIRWFIKDRRLIEDILLFCLLSYFASTFLYSNVFFDIGAFFNERFLFSSSLFFSLTIGLGLADLHLTKPKLSLVAIALLLSFFVYQTFDRSLDWKDDQHLVLNDVRVSTGSARANLLAGEASLSLHRSGVNEAELLHAPFENYVDQGIFYASNALLIYPEYAAPLDILGNLYFEAGDAEKSFEYFLRLFQQKPSGRCWNNLIFVTTSIGKQSVSEGWMKLQQMEQLSANREQMLRLYSNFAPLLFAEESSVPKGISLLEKSVALETTNPDIYNNLGTSYAIQGRISEANSMYRRAFKLGLRSPNLLSNLAQSYEQLNKSDSATYYRQMIHMQ